MLRISYCGTIGCDIIVGTDESNEPTDSTKTVAVYSPETSVPTYHSLCQNTQYYNAAVQRRGTHKYNIGETIV